MEVKIKAIHFDATEKLQDFINKKVDKLCKHHEEISVAEVNLKVVKPETAMNKEAAVKLIVPQREDLFASKVADTFEEAVDLCVDALKRQLEKSKKDK
ncbi:MAG: ribosome-associated translation inhibitor RaiA [Muribaculaceae bacterium]|nr:ribosome-associated translation inhibitor RaiA [Muribaculaceae bacterium]HAP49873.1 ribosome-associated translation inhibitor RaiA [Porphyromonadaceae bacterium]